MTDTYAVLWDEAMAHIQDADAVALVGYRFPPTDAFSRERVLSAINANTKQHVSVHSVLGPGSPDTGRVEGMVMHVATAAGRTETRTGKPFDGSKTYLFRAQPLYAEDFLGVAGRESLCRI